jgi:hypothetical protein
MRAECPMSEAGFAAWPGRPRPDPPAERSIRVSGWHANCVDITTRVQAVRPASYDETIERERDEEVAGDDSRIRAPFLKIAPSKPGIKHPIQSIIEPLYVFVLIMIVQCPDLPWSAHHRWNVHHKAGQAGFRLFAAWPAAIQFFGGSLGLKLLRTV